MWHIWKNKNRWTFTLEKWTELEVVQRASEEWMEFKKEHPLQKREQGSTIKVEKKEACKAPAMGVVRLNVSLIRNCREVEIKEPV